MLPIQPAGYFAMPAAGKGSPVLVLHAWWGLNETIKAFCNRLADEGFAAFAPDLYHGEVTDQMAEAEHLVTALDAKSEQAKADIATAVTFLRAHVGSDAPDLAVVGFSLGAFYALDLSISMPEIVRSVVIFYGTGPSDFERARADYLGHFAENDPFEPQSSVDGLAEALKSVGRPATFHQYPGTGHWFFEADRVDAYNSEAAKLAWERTVAFLQSSAKL